MSRFSSDPMTRTDLDYLDSTYFLSITRIHTRDGFPCKWNVTGFNPWFDLESIKGMPELADAFNRVPSYQLVLPSLSWQELGGQLIGDPRVLMLNFDYQW